MSAIKGWEGVVKYSERQHIEDVGLGDNADLTWDLDYPAVNELGVVTDDATKIEVFLDGVLKTPTTDYTLDGDGGVASVGEITFVVAPGTDVVIEASYYAYKTIGYIQSVGLSNSNNVEAVHQLGSRGPVEAKEGNIDIGLSMERAFIDLSVVATCAHEISAARGWLASELFDIDIHPKGDTGGDPLMTVRGKFNNYTFDLPQDGLAMETVDMVGVTITVTTV